MELINFIRAACSSKQVPTEYAEKIQKIFNITEQQGIDVAIDAFKENILPELKANANTVEEAKKEALKEYEEKHNLKDGKPVERPKPTPQPTPPPNLGLQQEIQELKTLVGTLAQRQSLTDKQAAVKKMLKGKVEDRDIERVAKRVNLDAEDLNTEVEAQVKDFKDLKQELINTVVAEGDYVPKEGSVSDKEFSDYLDRNKESESEFEAVKV